MRIHRAIGYALKTARAAFANARRQKSVSVLTQERIREAIDRQYNPLRSITAQDLITAIENYRIGLLKDAARIWQGLEEQDDMLRTVCSKRKAAAARLPWEILTVPDAPESEAALHKEALESFYNSLRAVDALRQNITGGVSLLVRQMMDAVNKGYAAHEIVWKPSPNTITAEARFVPLHFFEARTGRLRYLETDSAQDGADMFPGEWVVTATDPLMIAAGICAFYRGQPLRDWLAFCDKFGIPGLLGSVDGQPGSEEWVAMETALASIVSDWAAVKSRDASIELLQATGAAGALPFPALVDYLDRKIATLYRGADLSTIAKDGAAVGASLQGDETALILDDDASLVSETLNDQLDPHVISWHFGAHTTPLAYFKLITPRRQNIDVELRIDDFLLTAGAPLARKATLERYGRPTPNVDDELLVRTTSSTPNPFAFANTSDSDQQTIRDTIAATLQPLREALAKRLRNRGQ